ncbi:MAG: nucleoside kinase [Oscillospiraceae bacterium]|nr:nucleoside kinase [Oscillospiraceae bacterium]
MACQWNEINHRAETEPQLFLLESDALFQERVQSAAVQIAENRSVSPIVLLSGPSSSGKTTTAMKLREALEEIGISTHVISMDDYFITLDPKTAPRTKTGEFDFESPDCLDWPLLNHHFTLLEQGEEICIPKFNFPLKARDDNTGRMLQLRPDEMVIVEGIHAFRDELTDRHPSAFKFYINVQSDIWDGNMVCFYHTWMRLVRRAVRDHQFRGADMEATLSHWVNVRRGEAQYVIPFRYKANLILDSVLPYEVSVMKQFVVPLLKTVPEKHPQGEKVQQILKAVNGFVSIDSALVSENSLLREFIGGGRYAL